MIKIKSILKHFVPSSIIQQKLLVNKSILFTFDDGPHPEITPRILDILEKHEVRGLFFLPGNRIAKAPKLVKEIIDRKHGIGNHGFTHTNNKYLTYCEQIEEIKKCRDEIHFHSGVVTNLYRPPFGDVNSSLVFAVKKCKNKILRWSLDSGEYSYMRNSSPSEIAGNLLKKIHDRAIILSHDDHETTPEYLKLVLPRLKDMGFDMKNGLSSLEWKKGMRLMDKIVSSWIGFIMVFAQI